MAQPIHKILFTSDLAKSSVKIFEQTIMLASQLGASITMLHVIEDGSSSTQNRMIHLVDREVYEKIRQEFMQFSCITHLMALSINLCKVSNTYNDFETI